VLRKKAICVRFDGLAPASGQAAWARSLASRIFAMMILRIETSINKVFSYDRKHALALPISPLWNLPPLPRRLLDRISNKRELLTRAFGSLGFSLGLEIKALAYPFGWHIPLDSISLWMGGYLYRANDATCHRGGLLPGIFFARGGQSTWHCGIPAFRSAQAERRHG
jgi:hypothetical protein